jgi:uncharacterized protein
MIPSKLQIEEVHKRYAQNDKIFELVYRHCQIVAEIALWCAEEKNLNVDLELLEAGCLLHDIGTYALFDANGLDGNEHNYKQHAIFGAALAVEEGFENRIADMIRTHVLMGLTKKEIIAGGIGMPQKDYLPKTLEAELLCYADRFHSKHPTFNAYETFLDRLENALPDQGQKLRIAAERFGIPDVEILSRKYNHPIR